MTPQRESLDQLREEYKAKRTLYERLCHELVTQLGALLSGQGISLAAPIESRVKEWDSIAGKCERRQLQPDSLQDIWDIAGIRFVLLFKPDLATVCRIIEDNLTVETKEDTLGRLGADQFGYGSIHYVASPPTSWLAVPTLRQLEGLRAEIQVRTASQHIWAVASHVLQYKREQDVPLLLRRAINRVAALLETVDLEFERVLSDRGEYVAVVEQDRGEVSLNADSLQQTLDHLLPPQNKHEDHENYSSLLISLEIVGIKTTRELRKFFERNSDAVFEKEAKAVEEDQLEKIKGHEDSTEERIEAGVYFTHTGLVLSAIWEELGYIEYEALRKAWEAAREESD